MKGCTGWNYRPYRPFNHRAEALNPFICRLAPFKDGVEVQIVDNGCPEAAHSLMVRPMGTMEDWRVTDMDGLTAVISGLSPWMDYEIVAVRADDASAKSALRFFRTGDYPGRIVNYLHPKDALYAFSGRCLCNPCLVKLPDGTLLSCMDVFAGGAPQNLELIFRSKDRGETWEYVADLFPCYWGTLFVRGDEVYMIATTTENGDLIIGASYDGGETWTKPVMLFPGGGMPFCPGWQRQPMPVLRHGGRLMMSVEYGTWAEEARFGICTLSAPEDADLLNPESWTVSDGTHYDKTWPNAPKGGHPALLEGNLYAAKDGRVLNLLRMQINDCDPAYGLACWLEADMDDLEAAPKFDRIAPMPSGANTKTYVQYDEKSGKYWAIGNIVTDPKTPAMRSVVALEASDDGYDWRVVNVLYDFSVLNPGEVGMQYHNFIIDGDDILWLSRTAFNQARNFHDSNCQTFHVIRNFRKLDE